MDPFPWGAGVFDAHCHPTDTMASATAQIPKMKARAMTIMATRSQDQELVANVAALLGVESRESMEASSSNAGDQVSTRVLPSFGWHPWFSYQLYDDTGAGSDISAKEAGTLTEIDATAHYTAVLTPSPPQDFIASLPKPTLLSSFIAETRARLLSHPLALVGEIGLDKAFRLPDKWTESREASRDTTLTPGGREGRLLSPHHVLMAHQIAVLKAQLALAGELGRPVSVHGVQAHGVLHDALASTWKGYELEVIGRRKRRMVAEGAEDFSSASEDEDDEDAPPSSKKRPKGPGQPFPPRVCLHSFSGSAQVLRQYMNPAVPAKMFVSFSSVVNFSTPSGSAKSEEVIRAAPDDRILVESDLHIAGEEMDTLLEEMYRKVCEIKGWEIKYGVERIGKNFRDFVFGS
jgi:Tat protein secretion system quality control protein TatD with DNase activity